MSDLGPVSAPGYFITFAYTLAAIVYCRVNPRRLSKKKTAVLQCAGLILINILAYFAEQTSPAFYFVRLILFYLLMMGFMAVFMQGPFVRVLYFFPFVIVLGELIAALDWHFYTYGVMVRGIPDILPVRLPFFFIYYFGVSFLAYLVNRRFTGFNADMDLPAKSVLQPWILAVLILVISNVSNFLPVSPLSSEVPGQVFLIRLLVDISGAFMLYLFHTMRLEAYKNTKVEMLSRNLEMQYANYQVLKQSVDLVAGNYHDLKHQIQFLESGEKSADRKEFIDKLKRDMEDFEAQANTGNEMLDTIVMSKRLTGRKDHIDLTCIADGAQLSFMEPMDLSALFGNLIDNAMEAVRKIDDPERRLIRLTVERKKGFILILCENCFDGILQMQDGLPVTTKKDSIFHGYGTRSISAIARRYNGSAQFAVSDGWFHAKVLMPAAKK